MPILISDSEKDTKQIAQKLAKKIDHGVIALSGNLGTGKTTFVQGFAKGLGISEKIISPTFVLIRQHQIPSINKVLYHIDLYRLEEWEIKNLGLEDLLNDSNNLILIEWANKIKHLLPKKTINITIKVLDKNSREINIPKV